MNRTAFRIVPGRQPGLYQPQFGKRVFWFFWQWHNIGKTAVSMHGAVMAMGRQALDHDRANSWKAAVSGDIKP